jgi:hypothetical protein
MFSRHLTTLVLAVACTTAIATLAGCGKRTLDRADVEEFVNLADDAARKRFAPEICKLRAQDFKLTVKLTPAYGKPSEIEMGRKLFCVEAGKFARLEQYVLERKSMTVELASDRKSARVIAEYVEKMPYYEPGALVRFADDYIDVQVLTTRDDSTVGLEDGAVRFLKTTSEATQKLYPRGDLPLPYN